MRLVTAILAGGASERMGRDKAMLRCGPLTFLEHTAAVASEAASQVVVIGRTQPADWQSEQTIFLPDDQAGQGPLGGLITALRYAKQNGFDGVLITACDMPGLTIPAFQWLLNEAQGAYGDSSRQVQGCITVNDNQLEPLFGVYFVSLLELAEHHLAQNRRALHRLIENGDFKLVEVPQELRPALRNVNTPEEFAQFSTES